MRPGWASSSLADYKANLPADQLHYTVSVQHGTCTCGSFGARHEPCKHMFLVLCRQGLTADALPASLVEQPHLVLDSDIAGHPPRPSLANPPAPATGEPATGEPAPSQVEDDGEGGVQDTHLAEQAAKDELQRAGPHGSEAGLEEPAGQVQPEDPEAAVEGGDEGRAAGGVGEGGSEAGASKAAVSKRALAAVQLRLQAQEQMPGKDAFAGGSVLHQGSSPVRIRPVPAWETAGEEPRGRRKGLNLETAAPPRCGRMMRSHS